MWDSPRQEIKVKTIVCNLLALSFFIGCVSFIHLLFIIVLFFLYFYAGFQHYVLDVPQYVALHVHVVSITSAVYRTAGGGCLSGMTN